MKTRTMTQEEFEKLTPEEKQQIAAQFKAAQAAQKAIDERDRMITIMTWELVKKQIGNGAQVAIMVEEEEERQEIFEDCFQLACHFVSFTENKKQEAQDAQTEASGSKED